LLPWVQALVNFVTATRVSDQRYNLPQSTTIDEYHAQNSKESRDQKKTDPSLCSKSSDPKLPYDVATISDLCKVLILDKYAHPSMTHHYYEHLAAQKSENADSKEVETPESTTADTNEDASSKTEDGMFLPAVKNSCRYFFFPPSLSLAL